MPYSPSVHGNEHVAPRIPKDSWRAQHRTIHIRPCQGGSERRPGGAVFAGVGLGVIQVLALLVPFLCGLLVLAGLFAASVYLMASPVLLLIQDGWTAKFFRMLPLLAGLVGVGLILWVAAVKGTLLLRKWMLAILQRNVESIRRKLA